MTWRNSRNANAASGTISLFIFAVLIGRVAGIDGPVVELTPDQLGDPDDAAFRTTTEVTTAGMVWSVDTWSDDSYGPSITLMGQSNVWLLGTLGSLFVALVTLGRSWQRRRLAAAEFELAHARTLASTDGLTGLLNRQGLVDSAREQNNDAPMALFFVDLDGFKSVNDIDGHDAGDHVLRDVANQLRSIFRKDDLLSRLGGDEFVVFAAYDHGKRTAEAMAERIIQTVGSIDDRVSCSVGFAVRPAGEPVDVKDLMRAADEAMYQAKRDGGNRHQLSNLITPNH